MPHPLSHKCLRIIKPCIIAPFPYPNYVTSHFMCMQNIYIVNIDVPASVGAPPPDTQLHNLHWAFRCLARPQTFTRLWTLHLISKKLVLRAQPLRHLTSIWCQSHGRYSQLSTLDGLLEGKNWLTCTPWLSHFILCFNLSIIPNFYVTV